MKITEAIQKAIDNGWKHTITGYKKTYPEAYITDGYLYEILLDYKFWKCLGKSLDWKQSTYTEGISKNINYDREECDLEGVYYIDNSWLYHWHSFLDNIAEGLSIEDYFKELE